MTILPFLIIKFVSPACLRRFNSVCSFLFNSRSLGDKSGEIYTLLYSELPLNMLAFCKRYLRDELSDRFTRRGLGFSGFNLPRRVTLTMLIFSIRNCEETNLPKEAISAALRLAEFESLLSGKPYIICVVPCQSNHS